MFKKTADLVEEGTPNHHPHSYYNPHHHHKDHNHDIKGLGALPSPRLGICPWPSSQLAMNARSTTIPHYSDHCKTTLLRPIQYHTAQTTTLPHCSGLYNNTLLSSLQYHTAKVVIIPHCSVLRLLQYHTTQAITIPYYSEHYNTTLLKPVI